MSSAQEPKKRSLGILFRHGSTYSLVPIAAQVIAIVMTSFLTDDDWLVTEEMGVNQIVDLCLAMFVELLGVSAFQGMVRIYFEHKSERDRKAVISSTVLLSAILSWVVCGICLLFSEELRAVLITRHPTSVISAEYLNHVVLLLLLLVPFQMTTQAGFKYLQIHHESALFSKIQISKMLFELSLKIFLVAPFGLGLGVKGILASVLVGEALTTIFLTGWVLKRVGWRIDWAIVKPVITYSMPLVVASLCQFALHRSDTRLLEELAPDSGLVAAGIYGIGYRIGYLANAMMLGPFMQIFLPWIYALEDRKEQVALIARVTTYILVLYGFATVGLTLFSREALLVLDQSEGHKYEAASRVVPLVGGAYVFWAIYRTTIETSFYMVKKTAPLTWFNFAALAVNIVLNLLLIPDYGMVGAAAATVIAFGVLAVLGLIGSYRAVGVRLEYGRVAACLTLVAVAGVLAVGADETLAEPGRFSGVAVATKAPYLALTGFCLWRFVLRTGERADFRAWIAGRLSSRPDESTDRPEEGS